MVKRGVLEIRSDKKQEVQEVLEEPSSAAYLLSRSLDLDSLLYLESGKEITRVFLVTPWRTSYFGEFKWGSDDIVKAYTDEFGVPEETAWGIYEQFVKDGLSPTVSGKMKRVFQTAFKRFLDALTLNLKDLPDLRKLPPIYFKGNFFLPNEVDNKTIVLGKRRSKLRLLDQKIDVSDLVNRSPYNVYEGLNELAKRRIKWLMP